MNKYDYAIEFLPKLEKRQAFVSFCAETRSQVRGQTLQSLLILPIQRLPRYRLCLTEIIKNTENNHPDLKDLKEAARLVDETTKEMNEKMKEYEARQTVSMIETRFSSSVALVKPHRKFIKEGVVIKIEKTGKEKECTFFLFNDILCYGTGRVDRMKLNLQIPIDNAFYAKDISNHKKYFNNAFEIHSSIKSFIVICDNETTRNSWLQEFEKVLTEYYNQGNDRKEERDLAAPLMTPDDFSDGCMISNCGAKFTFLNRRHHCRYCGLLICSKCGKYRLASKMNSECIVKPICISCFEKFKNIYPAPKNGLFQEDSEHSDEDGLKILT